MSKPLSSSLREASPDRVTLVQGTERSHDPEPLVSDAAPGRRVGETALSGSFEALFEPCALDDRVAVAEAATHLRLSVLVPEARDLGFELGMLGRDGVVVALSQDVQKLGTPLGGALDFEPDVIQGFHTSI